MRSPVMVLLMHASGGSLIARSLDESPGPHAEMSKSLPTFVQAAISIEKFTMRLPA